MFRLRLRYAQHDRTGSGNAYDDPLFFKTKTPETGVLNLIFSYQYKAILYGVSFRTQSKWC